MKKVLVLTMMILMLGASPALASEEGGVPAGITPGHQLYWLDRLAERVQLLFTLSPRSKVEALSRFGLERLAEAQEVDGPETVGKLISDYRSNRQQAEAVAGKDIDKLDIVANADEPAAALLNELTKSANAGDPEVAAALEAALARIAKVSERLEKLADKVPPHALNKQAQALDRATNRLNQIQRSQTEAVERVREATGKHQAVLEGVLEKAPEAARGSLQKAIDKSGRGAERAVEAIENRQGGKPDSPETTTTPEPDTNGFTVGTGARKTE
jgi:hypothetical protein